MKQTAKAGKAITVSALELQVLELTDKVEQLEATRVTYDDLAAHAREVKALLAQRVLYDSPVVVSHYATWLERLTGWGRRVERVSRFGKVSFQ